MSRPLPEAESNKKVASSVQDVLENKPAFGSRFLTEEDDVWSQNAWDHVPPPDDQVETIEKSLSKQRLNPVPLEDKIKLNEKPAKHWDNFYKMNADNFFRNRKWLHNEFPELVDATKADGGAVSITEVGCGAGNSVFPLLASNQNPELYIRAYDYSSHAVKLVQNNPLYTNPPTGKIQASVWDVTSANSLPSDLAPGSADIVIMVFVMSALHPDEWGQAINNVHKILKPGGVVLFRDYGRYDLTQLRFKGGRLLDENFYIRGDKTRVYFFELGNNLSENKLETTISTTEVAQDEDGNDIHTPSPEVNAEKQGLSSLSSCSVISESSLSTEGSMCTPPIPAPTVIHPNLLSPLSNCPPHPLFAAEQLGVDRRLIVNRKRQIKMYRVWMQGKFRKL
ncbi:tRNA(Thr) (cytosine(32)-N(3))-methyltransferase [Psilocybe cubensis]|uniref:tRNA(Thr) (Cytosine(32)-N(3))-methyltransferase n=1 Tax=Psilocybe cubensis TaxID=181762 RepID=A0ACB8GUN4_PSICU|nr:tRNA(Thr) (cytosine(32)-N(3))-methyltransferase [Psilocybe cubensis]KAH9479304.1 tRNA(Thr) (cytosine(32)-N(3))-methyltransferase [Psilocybe cubensis]